MVKVLLLMVVVVVKVLLLEVVVVVEVEAGYFRMGFLRCFSLSYLLTFSFLFDFFFFFFFFWGGWGLFVCWLLNVPATCECISGTDLHRQFYVLPH